MASSNIKLFDENKGNMLSDSEFSISNQRLNGLQTGVASSQLQNKAMYQASLVAYAIAQVMMQNGKNANDTDAVSAFVANLSGTMLQKVYDIATTAEAQAGVATGKWMSPALVKAAIDYKFTKSVTFGSTVTLAKDPTKNLQAATKQYVDNAEERSWIKVGNFTKNMSESGFVGFTESVTIPFPDFLPKEVMLKGTVYSAVVFNSSSDDFLSCSFGDLMYTTRYENQTINNAIVKNVIPVSSNYQFAGGDISRIHMAFGKTAYNILKNNPTITFKAYNTSVKSMNCSIDIFMR